METKYWDFSRADMLQLDIETKDPNLKQAGSGVYRKDGYIIGVSIGDMEGRKEYYPLAHPETRKGEADKNLDYIKDVLQLPIPKIGANIKYDLDWLCNGEGLKIRGDIHDIQIAEPILNEYRYSYSLQNLSKDYLEETKLYEGPYNWCIDHGIKLKSKGDAAGHLWKMPADIVRPYACGDVDLPGRIFKIQEQLLRRQNLWELYRMECELIPMLLLMRKTGVRVNKDRMMVVGMNLADAVFEGEKALFNKLGRKVNIKSTKDVQWVADKYGLEYKYKKPTAIMQSKGITQGNPCLDKNALKGMKHEVMNAILDIRHMKTLNSMFIQPYFDLTVGDRLHGDFNQLKSDDSGTVSGRFSGTNPNLQQVSSKDEEDDEGKHPMLKGKVIRDLFIPEENTDWLKHDWSQIEYRIIAHYAIGPRSEEIRNRYKADPNTDYHAEMGAMTGLTERKIIKTLNFGAAYGMGPAAMARHYGWDVDYALQVYKMYHAKVPFVRETSDRVSSKAKKVGFIKTLLGRRARLKDPDKAYVMFNRLIQGSAADIMKKSMLDAYNAGLFEVLPLHMTVHDEMDNSKPRTNEGTEAARELKYIMEHCVPLKIPIIADAEIGPTWGTLEDYTA